MSKYDPVDFSSQYQSTFNEAAAGGVGISKLQQPGVNGTNISVNYASSGTATLTRDSNGGIVSEATGDAATAHTMNNNQVLTVLQAFDFIRIGVISSIEIQRVGDGFVIYLIGAEQNWAIRSQRNDQPRIFKSLQAAVNIIDDLGVPTEIIKIPIIRG